MTSGTEAKAVGAGDAGASQTQNLSETLAQTGDSSDAAAKKSESNEAERTYTTAKGRSRGESIRSILSRADMVTGVVESTQKNETSGTGAAAKPTKSESPSGEKEKVSKMEKLKEKLHIGHKH